MRDLFCKSELRPHKKIFYSYVLIALLTFLPTLISPLELHAADQTSNVLYSGLFLMGNKQTESYFPTYKRNQASLMNATRVILKQINESGQLPFNLIFDTDIETRKSEIDNTLSLALVVVRDDVNFEHFETTVATINKTVVNVGLTAILYDTRNIDGKDRNTVVYSFPLVGYSQQVHGAGQMDQKEIDDLFIKTATSTLKDYLIKRLSTVALTNIEGIVTDVQKGTATINIGSLNGLDRGQNVKFYRDDQKIGAAPITNLEKNSAVVELPAGFEAKTGMHVKASNIKGISDETYQVVDVKVSSKKVAALFPPQIIGPQIAQWFSNFFADRSGKVILPSRVGGEWDTRATENSFKLIDKEGNEHQFELPLPKYPIFMDITGISSKVSVGNDVNDICLYKAWISVNIPTKNNYSREFDAVSSKSVVKGIQSYEEKDEFTDLLYQLTAKIAKENEL